MSSTAEVHKALILDHANSHEMAARAENILPGQQQTLKLLSAMGTNFFLSFLFTVILIAFSSILAVLPQIYSGRATDGAPESYCHLREPTEDRRGHTTL